MHEVDQKNGSQEKGLEPDVPLWGEYHSELIGVREALIQQAAPLLGDLAGLDAVLHDPEGPWMQARAEELKGRFASAVAHQIETAQEGKTPFNHAERRR